MVDSWWMVRAACFSFCNIEPRLNLCNTPVTVLQLKYYFVSYLAAAAIEAIRSIWMMQRTWDSVSLCKSQNCADPF